ncbi:glycosyltransferase [Shouchella shacheensis]|uniref:glycosyltransferase n=1 Tax=Shouchella shacheensis TaxID=1649580 RepID=UPI000740200D|nr:glycosyltransferase [Shouchella shacheensis]
MKKIYFFLSNLNGGGAQRTVVNILNYINKKEFDCKLVLLDYTEEQAYAGLLKEDIEIINLKKRAREAILPIYRLLKKENPDILFSTLPQVNFAVTAAHTMSRSKAKLVLRESNHRGTLNSDKKNLLFTKMVYRRADSIVALSKGVARDIKDSYKISENKIVTVYNPVDVDLITSLKKEGSFIKEKNNNSEKLVITACGRLTEQKNFDLLIDSLSELSKYKPQFALYILGEGELESHLRSKICVAGLEKNIVLLGFQENPYKYLADSDLFVLTSLWEGFGHVLVEAMASGTPVISTDCPHGPSEIISDKVGWLISNNSKEELVKLLKAIVLDKKLLKDKESELYEHAYKFKASNIVKSYEKLFGTVADS